jgi:hypothetical protein
MRWAISSTTRPSAKRWPGICRATRVASSECRCSSSDSSGSPAGSGKARLTAHERGEPGHVVVSEGKVTVKRLLISDPRALATQLRGKERSWLRRRKDLLERAAQPWWRLPDEDADNGHIALRIITGL